MAQSSYNGSAIPGSVAGHRMSRRNLLRGAAVGAGAVTLPALLAGCSSGPGGDSKTIRLGSNSSDAVPKKAFADAFAAYEKQSKAGRKIKVNTVDHNTFQENINRYLQGKPDDVFMWFAGYRMQFFANKGLLYDISDLWKTYQGFSPALKDQSTGEDGKQYFTPYYYYPWAVFHRKSVFDQHGYTAPKTLDQYIALAKQMQKDKLIPIAFCDKDGNSAAVMIAEVAAFAKSEGTTLVGLLDRIFSEFGFYLERGESLTMEGAEGAAQIKKLVDSYASKPPTTIDKAAVSSTTNFATETIHDSEGDRIPSEAMLMITLADNRRVAVRPSGTEPKIKYYMFAAEPLSDGKTISADELEATKKRVTDSLERLWKELKADANARASA